MGYVKWSYETLNHFCGDVFKAFGFTEEESNQIKDVLLTADLYGIESHGMQRMVRYHKRQIIRESKREPSIRRQSLKLYLKHRYLQ